MCQASWWRYFDIYSVDAWMFRADRKSVFFTSWVAKVFSYQNQKGREWRREWSTFCSLFLFVSLLLVTFFAFFLHLLYSKEVGNNSFPYVMQIGKFSGLFTGSIISYFNRNWRTWRVVAANCFSSLLTETNCWSSKEQDRSLRFSLRFQEISKWVPNFFFSLVKLDIYS